ncbi:hypothetical protein HY251_10085 [bacterium]|nr:hypothetical protein [bacterium]
MEECRARMETEKQRERPREEPGEAPAPDSRVGPQPHDVRVEAGITRCPYCHESIALEREPWLACEACLARHHDACWKEGSRCSACGSSRSLSRPGEESRDAWRLRMEKRLSLPHAILGGEPVLLVESRRPSLPAGEGKWARRLLGSPVVLERARTFDFEVSPARRGVWATRETSPLAVALSTESGRTTLRVQASLKDRANALFCGLLGGIGGGVGGGASFIAFTLGGGAGVAAWVLFCVLGAYLLARTILARFRQAETRRLDATFHALEQELSGYQGAQGGRRTDVLASRKNEKDPKGDLSP